jgi:hypothetical protein
MIPSKFIPTSKGVYAERIMFIRFSFRVSKAENSRRLLKLLLLLFDKLAQSLVLSATVEFVPHSKYSE